MMEAPHSFETSVLTRATRRNFSEGCCLHGRRRENFKCYTHFLDPLVINNVFLLKKEIAIQTDMKQIIIFVLFRLTCAFDFWIVDEL
jgi:hypothetical protein